MFQTHVAAMLARVKEAHPIHQRDPLFVELFRYADRIEATARRHGCRRAGRRTVPAELLQAHAFVVSAVIVNGRSEMMKSHPVPPRRQR